jgi:hypothetical protein
MTPDLVDKGLELGDHDVESGEVGGERVFGAERLPDPVCADGTLVDTARDPVVVGPRLAEVGVHELERLVAHVRASEDAEGVHLRGRGGPDAMEFADGQRLHESGTHLRRDDVLRVGLSMIGGELRQELVVAYAGRGVEAGPDLDLFADPQRDVAGERDALKVLGDVQIGFVKR